MNPNLEPTLHFKIVTKQKRNMMVILINRLNTHIKNIENKRQEKITYKDIDMQKDAIKNRGE